jgi:glutamate-1-semialdehyde aminotransferase
MGYSITHYPDAEGIYAALDAYLRYFDLECPRAKALVEEARRYIPCGVQHNLAFNYPFPLIPGREINRHMPAVEMFRMLGSGTEAVMAALRAGLEGAQGYFGVMPDLTCFGKVVAGGYPSAGGLGGRKDLALLMAAGLESGMKRAYVGGTLAANPLSAAAGYFTLREIEARDACAVAGRAGDRLTVGAMSIRMDYLRIGKVLKEIKLRKHLMEEYGVAYAAEGIVTLAGSRA